MNKIDKNCNDCIIYAFTLTICWHCTQYLRASLSRQPCERLLASPRRQLLCEGPVTLVGQFWLEFSLELLVTMIIYEAAADRDMAKVAILRSCKVSLSYVRCKCYYSDDDRHTLSDVIR